MANVVAICGSLRKGSFNRQLMNASMGLGPEGMTIKEAPSFAKLPIYNFDDQQSTGFPKDSDALHEAVRAADGVLIVSAEYNWSVPGGLKNAIDWVSRPPKQPFKDKVAALMGASAGPYGTVRGQPHLRQVLTALGVWLLPLQLLLPNAAAAFEEGGALKDSKKAQELTALLEQFRAELDLRSRPPIG